ncbi:hypothetical protein F2Q70_00042638 [Brassica cretica]|uniref:Uncharacterized protein n=1 Tax=Brassica cretica TaxID=69181 RepID=A0A8S9KGR9_BRACR|nr:hypothetical protein F2Q70_00042638 [Brassica cretica]
MIRMKVQGYIELGFKRELELKKAYALDQPLVTKQKNRTHFYEYIPAKSSESSEILLSLLDDVHGSRLKGKEIVESNEALDVVINGDGKVQYDLDPKRNVVSDLLLELEALPPALGSGVVGDVSRNAFEIGGTSNAPKKIDATLESDWALIGGKTPHSPQQRIDALGGMGEETNIIISPSRFSVLAVVDGDEIGEEETEEKEEGEIEEEESTADEQKVDLKKKDVAKSVRLRTGTSLKLSKQIPARAKDPKTGRNNIMVQKKILFKYKIRVQKKIIFPSYKIC